MTRQQQAGRALTTVAAAVVLAAGGPCATVTSAQTPVSPDPMWATPTFGRPTPVAPPSGAAGTGRVQPPGMIAPPSSRGADRSPSFTRMRDAGPSQIARPGARAFRPAPDTFRPPDGRPGHGGWRGTYGAGAGAGYALPVYWGSYQAPLTVMTPGAAPRSGVAVAPGGQAVDAPVDMPHGFLRLLVTPRTASVSVDGMDAGTADDFGGSRERSLPAGPHRVRIEADGYEPVTIDVRVPVNDTITLRRELERVPDGPAAAAPPPAPRVAHKTLYFIPRCYLGDSVPAASQLPGGCSLADLQTLP